MLTDAEFEKKAREAAKFVSGLDVIDGYPERDIVTILMALECGLRSPASNGAWDAYVMLVDVVNARDPGRFKTFYGDDHA